MSINENPPDDAQVTEGHRRGACIKNADAQLVGFCESREEEIALWRARSLSFKARRTWNVVRAFLKRRVTVRQCLFGLMHPAHVVGLVSREGGLLLVCPAAADLWAEAG